MNIDRALFRELEYMLKILKISYRNELRINMKSMLNYILSYNRLKLLLGVGGGEKVTNVDKKIANYLDIELEDAALFRKVRNSIAHLYDEDNINRVYYIYIG